MRQADLPLAIAILAALTLAGWSGGAAAIGRCDLPVSPPRTSAHRSLGPYDPPALACHPGYYCTVDLNAGAALVQDYWKAIKTGDDADAKWGYYWLHQMAKDYLARAQKSDDPLEFWNLKNRYHLPVTLDPPQGGRVSHTWRHCYTLAELDAARREAVRWAHYIMDIFLPQHFGRKLPDWLTGAGIPDPFAPGSGADGGGK